MGIGEGLVVVGVFGHPDGFVVSVFVVNESEGKVGRGRLTSQ